MDTEVRRTPTTGAVLRVAGASEVASSHVLFAGRIASDAAAIVHAVRDLLAADRPFDADLLDRILAVEAEAVRFARRLQHPDAVCAGRCTPHLLRDARHSIDDAHALVDDLLRR